MQDKDFLSFVQNKISKETRSIYRIPAVLPKLYRYRPLNKYTIDDIIKDKITITSIGEFNDVFDGAMHQYGTKEEIEKAAEQKWRELDEAINATGLPNSYLKPDDIIVPYRDYYKEESRLSFRRLDYLGTYVCCFSTDNTSTLMWSHYADSNKGICVEYDFNAYDRFRQMIFPIVYSQKPIDVRDLLNDEKRQICPYPLDVAVLCTALNKASVWSYENEWRLVLILSFLKKKERRIDSAPNIKPRKIYFGYHFLKHFFYYDKVSSDERDQYKALFKNFLNLLSYIKKNAVPISIMVPDIGSYRFKPLTISVDNLHAFLHEEFDEDSPENMRYYYTIHDRLMDLLEKT